MPGEARRGGHARDRGPIGRLETARRAFRAQAARVDRANARQDRAHPRRVRASDPAQRPVTPEDRASYVVAYPSRFELSSAGDLLDGTQKFQAVAASCGSAPNVERQLMQAIIRQLLLGLTDDEYQTLDDELELLVETRSELKERMSEMAETVARSRVAATEGAGDEEALAGEDPMGQSGGTAVGSLIPALT